MRSSSSFFLRFTLYVLDFTFYALRFPLSERFALEGGTMSRLGVVLSTATEAPAKEFVRLGQLAEEKGFDAILVNEGRGDALACAEAIALATSRIKVGTNIANIYFRHPFLTAMTAATISELSNGRLLLGLGVSHRPLIESLGMRMEQPREYMRLYIQTVKRALGGQSIGAFFHPRP